MNRKIFANSVRALFSRSIVTTSVLYICVMGLVGCAAPTATPAFTLRAGSETINLRVEQESKHAYKRARDFGGWRAAGGDPECLDVRGQVLAAESLVAVTTSTPNNSGGCRVLRGKWNDPYTGRVITNGNDMDVDHVVPLKEAWDSGAWAWTRTKRGDYANDLADADHLIAVDKSANRSKGDQDPAEWLPPNQAYRCTYVRQWAAVKVRWSLAVDAAEKQAIEANLSACRR